MNTNELYNAPQELKEDLNLEIGLHDIIEMRVMHLYGKHLASTSGSSKKDYCMNRKQIIKPINQKSWKHKTH